MKTIKNSFRPAILKLLLGGPAIIFVTILFSLNASGQTNTKTKTETVTPPPPGSEQDFVTGIKEGAAYKTVDEMPVYPGGDQALLNYVAVNVIYPKDAKEKGIQGKVITRFIINSDGSVSDISILKSAYLSLDNEALRVIGTLPRFSPGKLKGKIVPVWFTLPISFTLK